MPLVVFWAETSGRFFGNGSGDFGSSGTSGSSRNSGTPRSGGSFSGAGGCFIAGTQIEFANGESQAIEKVKRGDVVCTNAAFKQTAVIEDLLVRESDDVHQLTLKPLVFDSGNQDLTLIGTGDHYVWSDTEAWTRIDKLETGDILHHKNGKLYKLVSTEKLEGSYRVYTLKVKDESVYYAGGFLVQELCGEHPFRATGSINLTGEVSEEPGALPRKKN